MGKFTIIKMVKESSSNILCTYLFINSINAQTKAVPSSLLESGTPNPAIAPLRSALGDSRLGVDFTFPLQA